MKSSLNSNTLPAGTSASRGLFPPSLPGILVLYGLSRALYLWLGVEYDDGHLRIGWQLIDPELLETKLLESLWYLHAQPPLFNLLCGLAVKLAPATTTDILNPAFIILGMLNLAAMDGLMRGMGVGHRIRWALLALTAFNPSFVLMENWFFYTHPLACMMTIAAWAWMRLMDSGRMRHAILVFVLLFSMVMIRSLFHLAWYVVLGGVALVLFRGRPRRGLAWVIGVPGFLIFLWYLKTFLMFGTFGSSTWLGMSMAKNTTFRLSQEERAALVEEGRLSPLAMILPFSRYTSYRDYLREEKTGIEILDRVYNPSGSINYNNLVMIDLCEQYGKDARWVLLHYPLRFAESQIESWANFCQSSSIYLFLAVNRDRIAFLDDVFNRVVYLQYIGPKKYNKRPGTFYHFYQPYDSRPFSVTIAVLFVLCAVWLPIRGRVLLGRSDSRAVGATMIFIWLNVLYVSCVGNLLEIGENNRFRFMIEPLFWVVLGIFLTDLARGLSRRFSGISGPFGRG